ncbi:MAG: glycosyltransferase family 2 protein [candidate division Zixibacteria bacterium]|nr:glycosyltransferase family 2 protein [candidate division Zixibacteria bacterium]
MNNREKSAGARHAVPLHSGNQLDLSIIIVNYRAKRFLKVCLDSIYNTKNNLRLEIWLIDNSSKDDTVPWVRENFPQVNLIENEWNSGFSKAANQGIRESQGKYLLLLNPDTKITEGKINQLLKFMDENPEAGICGPRMIDEKGELLYSCRSFPDLLTSISSSQSVLNRLFPHNSLSRKYLLKDLDRTGIKEVDWVSGSCLFARRKMLGEIGLLDENFFMFCEDTDLCLRAKKNGWKVFYFPFLTVTHQLAGSTSLNPLRAKLEHHRSMYYFFKKHYHPNPVFRLLVYLSLLGRLIFLSFVFSLPGTFKKK